MKPCVDDNLFSISNVTCVYPFSHACYSALVELLWLIRSDFRWPAAAMQKTTNCHNTNLFNRLPHMCPNIYMPIRPQKPARWQSVPWWPGTSANWTSKGYNLSNIYPAIVKWTSIPTKTRLQNNHLTNEGKCWNWAVQIYLAHMWQQTMFQTTRFWPKPRPC